MYCSIAPGLWQQLLKEWELQLLARTQSEKSTAEGKMLTKTQKQCKDYMRPFFRMCKKKVDGSNHEVCAKFACAVTACRCHLRACVRAHAVTVPCVARHKQCPRPDRAGIVCSSNCSLVHVFVAGACVCRCRCDGSSTVSP